VDVLWVHMLVERVLGVAVLVVGWCYGVLV